VVAVVPAHFSLAVVVGVSATAIVVESVVVVGVVKIVAVLEVGTRN
jgi:hypothetical protein